MLHAAPDEGRRVLNDDEPHKNQTTDVEYVLPSEKLCKQCKLVHPTPPKENIMGKMEFDGLCDHCGGRVLLQSARSRAWLAFRALDERNKRTQLRTRGHCLRMKPNIFGLLCNGRDYQFCQQGRAQWTAEWLCFANSNVKRCHSNFKAKVRSCCSCCSAAATQHSSGRAQGQAIPYNGKLGRRSSGRRRTGIPGELAVSLPRYRAAIHQRRTNHEGCCGLKTDRPATLYRYAPSPIRPGRQRTGLAGRDESRREKVVYKDDGEPIRHCVCDRCALCRRVKLVCIG